MSAHHSEAQSELSGHKNQGRYAGLFFLLSLLLLGTAGGLAWWVRAPYQSTFIEDWLAWGSADTLNAQILAGLIGFGLLFFLMFLNGVFQSIGGRNRKQNKASAANLSGLNMANEGVVAPAGKLTIEPVGFELKTETKTAANQMTALESMAISPQADFAPPRPLDTIFPSPTELGDPIAKALLAEAPVPRTEAPATNMDSVVSAAMSLIEPQTTQKAQEQNDALYSHINAERASAKPEALEPQSYVWPAKSATQEALKPEPALTLATPIAAPVLPLAEPVTILAPQPAPVVISPEEEIARACQIALSVWSDQVRPIAAEELSKRVAAIYHDPSPEAKRAFALIQTGELNAAAMTLHSHADLLAHSGRAQESADIWRAYGALHMGRDDERAMMAYEKVSELDPSDASIHMYLVRRFQMAAQTTKLKPVLGRALAVVSDEEVRHELLGSMADIHLAEGDYAHAALGLEELSRINQSRVIKAPDNVSIKSAYGISLAKLAQAREMMGVTQMAAPLYRMAHEVFSELCDKVPGHAGLRSMADNALSDSNRLNQAQMSQTPVS